jgi:hypothetical protein
MERFGENVWIGCFSGRQQIWRRSYSISNIFIMDIARMLGWKGNRPNQLLMDLLHGLVSLRTDGRSTAEGCIRRL